jgi:hypothetical protein
VVYTNVLCVGIEVDESLLYSRTVNALRPNYPIRELYRTNEISAICAAPKLSLIVGVFKEAMLRRKLSVKSATGTTLLSGVGHLRPSLRTGHCIAPVAAILFYNNLVLFGKSTDIEPTQSKGKIQ